MTDSTSRLKKVWNNYEGKMAKQGIEVSKPYLSSALGAIFSPGPFYYYIMDFAKFEFAFIHPEVEKILGLDSKTARLVDFSERVHPDDVLFYLQCEKVATHFLFNFLSPAQIPNSKVSYAFRMKDAEGQYRLFLQQGLVLTMDEQNRVGRVLGVHSDISHIVEENNRKISFIGMRGERSYLGLDVFKGEESIIASENLLSEREIEIIRLLAEGMTAKEIGDALFLSFHTVRTHRKNILEKLQCRNTTQLVAKCIKKGII